jgi:hypothetical protein
MTSSGLVGRDLAGCDRGERRELVVHEIDALRSRGDKASASRRDKAPA